MADLLKVDEMVGLVRKVPDWSREEISRRSVLYKGSIENLNIRLGRSLEYREFYVLSVEAASQTLGYVITSSQKRFLRSTPRVEPSKEIFERVECAYEYVEASYRNKEAKRDEAFKANLTISRRLLSTALR